MSTFVVTGTSLRTKQPVALANILELEILSTLDSPVVSMSGRFAVDAAPDELGAVTVHADGRLLFEGAVDRQSFQLSEGGRIVRLEARSKGALLLDNEAVPCVLTNIRLSTLFGIFIAPYGFTCYNPNASRALDMYTVRKGLSEWEVLVGFTRRAYNLTPYVAGGQVMVDRPRSTAPLVLSNSGEGVPFCKLEYVNTPYNVLSRVILRDMDGNYSAGVSNPSAAYLGVQRKRYVIPTTEFVSHLALDANQRIRSSMLDKELTTVTLPGLVHARIGQEASIRDKAFTLYNLLVSGVRYLLGKDGILTELSLVSSVYYT